jgi:signal transduction histidine kinase/ActR/RegA family two-component response regulator
MAAPGGGRVYYLPGSSVEPLARSLPAPLVAVPLDGPAASDPGPAILLVDGAPAERAAAGRLRGGRPELPADLPVVVVVDGPEWVADPAAHLAVPRAAPRALLLQAVEAALAHARVAGERRAIAETLARRTQALHDLALIGIRLSAERDAGSLLELTLTTAREATASDAGSLYLVETAPAGERRLRLVHVQNDSRPAAPDATLAIGPESVAGWVALTGEPVTLDDAYAPPAGCPYRPDTHGDRPGDYRTRSMLVVPLRTPKGEVLGVLQLVNAKHDPARRFRSPESIPDGTRPYTAAEREVAAALASQAAVALENARLYGELRAALGEVEDSRQRIVQAERLRALGEMAGGVAHDFNNVLAVVVGRAQLLLRQVEDPRLRRQIATIEHAGLEGARTVRRIQEFTRTRRTRPFAQVDLAQVAAEAVEGARSRFTREAALRGIRYDVRVETAPVPAVVGDAAELRECVLNLVLNALDAMPEGGRLTVATGAEGAWVTCAVADTGIGMTEEVRQRVFEPFFTTKAEQGTGLGLSVAYGTVRRHGGEIEVDSRPGQGARFVIRLPVAAAALPPPPETPLPGPGGPARVLVVEDEAAVRDVLTDALARQGHAVTACEDGRQGLARLAAGAFDVVLVDLGLPDVPGWEVVSRARRLSPAPVVALITGWGDHLDPDEARARGVDEVLAKPFDVDRVVAVVARAAGRGAGRRDGEVPS